MGTRTIPSGVRRGGPKGRGGSESETLRLGYHPSRDREAIPLPTFLDGCALSGLHSLRS